MSNIKIFNVSELVKIKKYINEPIQSVSSEPKYKCGDEVRIVSGIYTDSLHIGVVEAVDIQHTTNGEVEIFYTIRYNISSFIDGVVNYQNYIVCVSGDELILNSLWNNPPTIHYGLSGVLSSEFFNLRQGGYFTGGSFWNDPPKEKRLPLLGNAHYSKPLPLP